MSNHLTWSFSLQIADLEGDLEKLSAWAIPVLRPQELHAAFQLKMAVLLNQIQVPEFSDPFSAQLFLSAFKSQGKGQLDSQLWYLIYISKPTDKVLVWQEKMVSCIVCLLFMQDSIQAKLHSGKIKAGLHICYWYIKGIKSGDVSNSFIISNILKRLYSITWSLK